MPAFYYDTILTIQKKKKKTFQDFFHISEQWNGQLYNLDSEPFKWNKLAMHSSRRLIHILSLYWKKKIQRNLANRCVLAIDSSKDLFPLDILNLPLVHSSHMDSLTMHSTTSSPEQILASVGFVVKFKIQRTLKNISFINISFNC